MLCFVLPLSGCLVGTSQGRASTTVVRDTGVPGVDRTTVTSEHSGSSFGASVPIVMAGGGYGYGYGHGAVVTGPSCVLHPDACGVIQTSTVIQPVTVVSSGGGAAGGSGDASIDTADLEARIARLETAVPKLAGGTILSLRQSCLAILKDPGMIPDADERAKLVSDCEKVLKTSASSDGASSGSTEDSALVAFYAMCTKVIEDPEKITDPKRRTMAVDVCKTAIVDGLGSAAMRTTLRKVCKTIADDPELSGLAGAQDVITQCRKLNASGEENR